MIYNGPDRILPKGTIIYIPFIANIFIEEALYYDNSSAKEFTKKIQMLLKNKKKNLQEENNYKKYKYNQIFLFIFFNI